MKYKGYEAIVRYSDEDGTFIGEVINTHDLLVFDGTNTQEIETAFHAVVNEYLEDCEKEGRIPDKPFSGRFMTRIAPSLHRTLAIRARQAGMSLNAYVASSLEATLNH